MTRVCIRCGWFVFDRERCTRDGGPTITLNAAARACGVPGLFELQHVTPSMRVRHFQRPRKPPPRVFACTIDESGGLADD